MALYTGGSETFLPGRIEDLILPCTTILVNNPGLSAVVIMPGKKRGEVAIDLLCETGPDANSLGWSREFAAGVAGEIGGRVVVNAPMVAEQTRPGLAPWFFAGKQVAYVAKSKGVADFWGLPKGSNGWKVEME